ncbi:hypothetical protein B0O80DRAFT_500681 [Mortierella sp. GBAus27b]|nr:hypothetical protein B0O80DRAFT_500681 [Mortierella sp. GBAus27b]
MDLSNTDIDNSGSDSHGSTQHDTSVSSDVPAPLSPPLQWYKENDAHDAFMALLSCSELPRQQRELQLASSQRASASSSQSWLKIVLQTVGKSLPLPCQPNPLLTPDLDSKQDDSVCLRRIVLSNRRVEGSQLHNSHMGTSSNPGIWTMTETVPQTTNQPMEHISRYQDLHSDSETVHANKRGFYEEDRPDQHDSTNDPHDEDFVPDNECGAEIASANTEQSPATKKCKGKGNLSSAATLV